MKAPRRMHGTDERPPDTAASGRLSAASTVWPIVGLAVLLLALTVALPLSTRDDPARVARARAQQTADLIATTLSARNEDIRSALQSLAEIPSLRAAVKADDRAALDRLVTFARAAFPQADRVLVAPATGLRPQPDATPPIGYALSELVSDVLNSAEIRVEIHRPGTDRAAVQWVAPIGSDRPVGALVVSYPAAALLDTLPSPRDAHWRLIQAIGGATSLVGEGGTARPGDLEVSTNIHATPWRLVVNTPAAAPLAGIGQPLLLTATLVAAAVLVLAGVVLTRRLRAGMRRDGQRFTEMVDDLLAGRLQAQYPATVRELEPPLCAAVERARRLAPIGPVPDAPEATAPPSSPATDSEPHDATATAGDEAAPADTHHTAGNDEPAASRAVSFDGSILREYDVRGIVGEALTHDSMRMLGRALGSEAAACGQSRIVVGYDGRHSSPELADALMHGLVSTGREVINIGMVPTPVVYFATHFLDTQAGAMVTGSHNPPDYNGLKMVVGGESLHGDAIQDLGRRIEENDFVSGEGGMTRQDLLPDYLDRIARDVTLHRPLKVVIDCGNGAAGEIAPDLFRALGCDVEELFCEVDGSFPNHHPDPTVPENLDALSSYVRLQEAHIGIAFDGDGDRLGVVDDTGKIIWADRQMMLYAREILSRQPGADIVFDVKCTNLLADVITENAGVPIMWKTGHSLIKQKLRETGAPLAGEMTGHIFFNDRWYGFDDGLYAGARLVELVSMDPRSAAELFAELPEGISTPEIRVDLPEDEPLRIMARLLENTGVFEDARTTTIDGLRLDFPDGWGLVRASNTQPCLALRFEGRDEAALARIQARFRQCLEDVSPGIALPF